MTINISVKVNDGIVIAADSLVTIVEYNSEKEIYSYRGAEKIFKLFDDLPIGATTSGISRINGIQICDIIKDIAKEKSKDIDNYKISEIVQLFSEELSSRIKTGDRNETSHGLNLRIFGYSPEADDSESWHISINSDGVFTCNEMYSQNPGKKQFGVRWGGDVEAVERLVNGVSSRYEKWREIAYATFEPLCHSTMPIQDAIDLARFLADAASKFSYFSSGPTTVGGEIDIAVITRHEGFRWVSRKSLE